MTNEDFSLVFKQVVVETFPTADLRGLTIEEASVAGWMTISRILRKGNLTILPDDPIRPNKLVTYSGDLRDGK